ncbi:MAG: hypothetical protein R2746_08785 [Acidimicrobiales bacterium]
MASSAGPTSSASPCPHRPTTSPRRSSGLLLGLAFQHRLEPAVVPQAAVVDGLHRILGLAPATSDT